MSRKPVTTCPNPELEKCFARENGECGILMDTRLKSNPCPFYKSRAKFVTDRKRYGKEWTDGRRKAEAE